MVSLALTKFYKSQNQYFPTENIPQLEADASLLDLSNKGRCFVLMKIEKYGKRELANWWQSIHMQICSFQQHTYASSSMSVKALSRLLEAVAKSMKHATAISSILATELVQTVWDVALATSKFLLENSCYELRNAPVNAKSLFDNKIKEVAKANNEAQQQRFLASSSTNTNLQPSYSVPTAFKRPRQPNKPSRPKQTQSYRSKTQTQSFSLVLERTFSRVAVTRNSSLH